MHKLSVGDFAPKIETTDVRNKPVGIATSHYTLVTFLRYSGCQMCNLALQRLTLEYSLLQKNNCEVIAFVQSTPENIEKNIYHRHEVVPKFPIIADQKAEWYDRFGVVASYKGVPYALKNLPAWLKSASGSEFKPANIDGSLFLVPALFVIDSRGVVRFADYEANFYTHETFTPIYELLNFGESL